MQNDKTPNIEGLSEAEQKLIEAYRRGIAAQEVHAQTRHEMDFCNPAEVLAFAVITRLLANLTIQRSALFELDMVPIINDVAEAIQETARRIGIADLTK